MTPDLLENSKIRTTLLPWSNNQNVIWLASTLSLHRNIEKSKFPHKLDIEPKRQLQGLIAQAVIESKDLQAPLILKAEETSALGKNFLQEHFLVFGGFQEARQGEAFVIDDTGQFLALINVKDHLHLLLTDTAGDLEKSFSKLVAIENAISSKLNFAFSEKFGFLTSDPTISGTALVIMAFLHLPALIHLNMLTELLEKEKNDAVVFAGLQGNPHELTGDILTVSNNYTLGLNEEAIISSLRNTILKLVVEEKSARNKLKTDAKNLLIVKDKISRALGTLKSSYQLETIEALADLSLVKLGVELGYVKGLTVTEVNKLFFSTRRAHLHYCLKEKISNEELANKRGDVLREKMANVTTDFT